MLVASPLKQGVQGPEADEMTVQKQPMPEVCSKVSPASFSRVSSTSLTYLSECVQICRIHQCGVNVMCPPEMGK